MTFSNVENRQVLNHKVNIHNPGLGYKIFKGEGWWINFKISYF